MNFASPQWLYLLIPLAILGGLLSWWYHSTRRNLLQRLISPKLLDSLSPYLSSNKTNTKQTLFFLGLFFIVLTLARPQWNHYWVEQQAKGIDILFALDTSRSMLAEDIRPNRLERAKLSLMDFAQHIKSDRLGLIAFAGDAFLQCPLTLDYNAFTQTLDGIDTNVVGTPGTNLAAAIKVAMDTYKTKNNYKFLILITDGEDLGDTVLSQAQAAADAGLQIFTVGVGSPDGELIPITGPNGSTEFIKDASGKLVKSKLDESTLKAIAEKSQGAYLPLRGSLNPLTQLYQSALKYIPQEDLRASLKKVPQEKFQYPLAIALLCFSLEFITGTRRSKRSLCKLGAPLLIALFSLILTSPNLQASPRKGFHAYEAGNYIDSANYYLRALNKKPNNHDLHYNVATTYYQTGDYEKAEEHFNKALNPNQLDLQEKIHYNLGNTHYRQGLTSLETNPDATKSLWEQAVKDYESSLELNPQNELAQENIDFVKQQLEQLEQEQQDNQQPQDNSKQEPNDNNQEDQDNNQEQQSEDSQQNKDSDNNSDSNQSDSSDQQPEPQSEQNQDSQPQDAEVKESASPPQESSQEQQSIQSMPSYHSQAMTQEEAKALLESISDSENKLIRFSNGNKNSQNSNQTW